MRTKKQKGFISCDCAYCVPMKSNKKKMKTIAYSTKATSDFLGMVCENHPGKTINELKQIITDESQYIVFGEAVDILDKHIEYGCGDIIPNWKYD